MHKVVNLGDVRDLLGVWDKVRQQLAKGQSKGFALCLMDESGKETIYLGGHYECNAQDALKAAMAISWERTKQESAHALR